MFIILALAPSLATPSEDDFWYSQTGRRLAEYLADAIGYEPDCTLVNAWGVARERPESIALAEYEGSRWATRARRACAGQAVLALGGDGARLVFGRDYPEGEATLAQTTWGPSVVYRVPHTSPRNHVWNHPDAGLRMVRMLRDFHEVARSWAETTRQGDDR